MSANFDGQQVQNDMHEIHFEQAGDFAAISAAKEWCLSQGVSYGSMQRDYPIGLMVGDFAISKWTNMSRAEQEALHGTIVGSMRSGPVVIRIDGAALARSVMPAKLAGRCANGLERGQGRKVHAVPASFAATGFGKALCGAQPGRRSVGWTALPAADVTCPLCKRRAGGAS